MPRVERWIDRFIVSTELQLSRQQRQAVVMAASHQVLILSGGPSTGKPLICKTIVALQKAMGKTITLASPIIRAAQPLSEMTGREAKTLHRLLEIDPKTIKFKRDQDNPIPTEAIVVDEALKMDLFLANLLFKAVATMLIS